LEEDTNLKEILAENYLKNKAIKLEKKTVKFMIDNTEGNSLHSKEKTKCLFKEDSGKKLLLNEKNVDYDLVTRI
jgi:hypothetical protein